MWIEELLAKMPSNIVDLSLWDSYMEQLSGLTGM